MSTMQNLNMEAGTERKYTYYAFISYKHEDTEWAKWLQKQLHSYRLPSKICKQYAGIPRRLSPVFLDKTDLTPGELDTGLSENVGASKHLIVICSKSAYNDSTYIDKEIQGFLDAGNDPKRIIPFIVEKSDRPEKECFPKKLQEICETTAIVGVNIFDAGERLAFLKVVAYMHGLKPAEIESADDRRRRRNRKTAIVSSAFALILISFAAFFSYDYFVPKTEYYLDYTTKYGVPVGIGRLKKDEIAAMNTHYTIVSSRYKVRELRHENSAGKLTAHANTEYTDRPTKATYEYDAEGRLLRANYYDTADKNVLTMNYADHTGQIATVNLLVKNEEGRSDAAALSSQTTAMELNLFESAYPLNLSDKSSITTYLITYDENGYTAEQLYATIGWKNSPVSDSDGVWGLRYERDTLGRAEKIVYLSLTEVSPEYKEIGSKTGIYGKAYEYDDDYNMTKCTYYGKDGAPVFNERQWMICVQVCDAMHNAMRESFINENGESILCGDGYAEIAREYDNRGNVTREIFFGTDGQPILTAYGYATANFEYDELGNAVYMAFFGTDGQPVLSSYGYASAAFEYDELGNVTRIAFFDTGGKPILCNDGYAGLTREYDDRGNLIREVLLGTDGQAISDYDGYAEIFFEYDEHDNITHATYFGADGQPILSNYGYAGYTYEYDDRGNRIRTEYFGTDGQPILCNDGFAGWTREYDDRGNVINETYLGTDGQPIRDNAVSDEDDGHDSVDRASSVASQLASYEEKLQKKEEMQKKLDEAEKKLEALKMEAQQKFAPLETDDFSTLWGKMMRFNTLNMPDMVDTCFDFMDARLSTEDIKNDLEPETIEDMRVLLPTVRIFYDNASKSGINYGLLIGTYSDDEKKDRCFEYGDILVEIDGSPIYGQESYAKAKETAIGTIQATVLRRSGTGFETVTLDFNPENEAKKYTYELSEKTE
ncbi:MAG: TIR domain-containing protein [Clostridia bacterium]|nr:TIR domain-containing protein [Clostridia bacterium]